MNFTDAELGLYIRLLCVQWSAGSLPNDDAELASYGRGETSLARIRTKFKLGDDGRLRNARLEDERNKQAQWREKCSIGGKMSAQVRKGTTKGTTKGSESVVEGKGEVKGNTPVSGLQSPSPTPEGEGKPPLHSAKPPASRAQDEVFNALCLIEGSNPAEIGASGGRIAKCLKMIRASTPDVTPEEIRRRAANYPRQFKDAMLTADALAKWWAKCGDATLPGRELQSAVPTNLR